LQYVDNTTECFDGVVVQIRELLINARQWSIADQTFEQAQSGFPIRGFRDLEQRKGIPRLYQTFVHDHSLLNQVNGSEKSVDEEALTLWVSMRRNSKPAWTSVSGLTQGCRLCYR
jgi:hypothetical protein